MIVINDPTTVNEADVGKERFDFFKMYNKIAFTCAKLSDRH